MSIDSFFDIEMLLETLDIKKNDILIYSQNIFDFENNFKIIYKDDAEKTSCQISYGEVCRFINEFTPKNLIVYRLLTNIPDFEIFLSKYGSFLNINGSTELIYFDPIFAVKELEEYSERLNYDLRFRIQQVGLTTLNRFKNLPNYAEIYSVDMRAIEAKNQNDKVFADAIFSIERGVKKAGPKFTGSLKKNIEKNTILSTEISEKQAQPKSGKPFEELIEEERGLNDKKNSMRKEKLVDINENQNSERNPFEGKAKNRFKDNVLNTDNPPVKIRPPKEESFINLPPEIRTIQRGISEDQDFDYRQIMKLNFKGAANKEDKKNPNNFIGENSVSAKPKSESAFGKFLQNKQINLESNEHLSLGDVSKDQLTDIFKSSSSLKNLFDGKENQKVVLKLDKR